MEDLLILTADEIMEEELLLAGYTTQRQAKVNRKENLARFVSCFGVPPVVLAQLWEELQTTDIEDARVQNPNTKEMKKFLWTVHWLAVYPTEKALTGRTGLCDTTIRNNHWEYAKKNSSYESIKDCLA